MYFQFRPGQLFLLPSKMMKHLEAKSASSWADTTIRDYVCRSRHSVSLIFVYRTESQPGAPSLPRTNPSALLTHRETSPSPNQCGVFLCLFLNLVWSVLCSGMHPASCQMGESCSRFHLDQRYCWWWKKGNVQETNFSEARPHIKREKKVF